MHFLIQIAEMETNGNSPFVMDEGKLVFGYEAENKEEAIARAVSWLSDRAAYSGCELASQTELPGNLFLVEAESGYSREYEITAKEISQLEYVILMGLGIEFGY